MAELPPRAAHSPAFESSIPASLKALPQWVGWKHIDRGGKQTKCPIDAKTGGMADSTAPSTWSTFDQALAAWCHSEALAGIGFVFAADDGFCGVDLDNCIDPATNEMKPWGREIVGALNSYSEISPSGKGVKIFVKAGKPGTRCRKGYHDGEVEMYDSGRFFTVTGRRLDGVSGEVEARQAELDMLYGRVFDEPSRSPAGSGPPSHPGSPPSLTDDAIIEKASASKSGAKFADLWAGRWQGHFKSASEADSSLVFMLAFYTKSEAQIDGLFRRSGLFRPKWDERHGQETYGQMTVRKALERVTEQYDPGGRRKDSAAAAPDDADGHVALGEKDRATGKTILSAKRTLPTAEAFIRQFHTRPEGPTILTYAGAAMVWRNNRYVEVEDEALKKQLQPWLHGALRYVVNRRTGELELVDFESNPTTVKAALETVRTHAYLPARVTPPSWLADDSALPPAGEIVPCRTLNLHIPTGKVLPATPRLFTTNALDFDYDPEAEAPELWIKFLEQLWGDDLEQVELLQEWFGYCLTAVTSQQKMLLLVGPKRSGKGTIGRILGRLIGLSNVAGPTTGSLAGQFGLQPLIGKSLAIVSDARFSGDNTPTVVERLLCISGEDALTVDRKFVGSVTLKLPTRFMFLTNELPRMTDASGALAGRFVILRLTQTFYGREDVGLTEKLAAELPGILLWALAGWKRLHQRGRFVQPQSVQDAVRDMEELSSPVSAFVRERCDIGAGYRAMADDLYGSWKQWCEQEGRHSATTRQTFGRDLAAAVPGVVRRRGSGQTPFYEGIALKGGHV